MPGWPIQNPLPVPSAEVTLNNGGRDIESVSVRASVGSSDVSARTGSVVWAPGESVYQGQATVLGAGSPRRGDRVTVGVGDGAALARVFTGKVDTTSSDVPGPLVSDLMDDWDMLSAEVDIPALTATMHPDVDEGPLRAVGLTSTWPMQRALAQAGFRATPSGWPGGVLTASLNGSLWPEVGEVMSSVDMPSFIPAPWGDGARNYAVTYAPGVRSFPQGDLQFSFLVGNTPSSGSSFLSCVWAGGHLIQVVVNSDRSVNARLSTGTPATVISLSAAQMSGAEHVVLRVSSAGVWRLVADNGQSVTGSTSVPASMLGVPAQWTINVSATSQPIGGVNTGFASTAAIPTFTRTANLSPSTGTLAASRAFVSTPARDVLKGRAEAEQGRMWIDSHGVFQWRSYNTWGTGNPVHTISDVDLLGYRVSMDYDSIYSGVTVSHLGPIVDVRKFATVTLFQGSRQSLNAGDRETTVITVPDDEDWPALDWSLDRLALDRPFSPFNNGKRSWTGAIRTNGTDEAWAYGAVNGEYATFDFEVVNSNTWIHTTTISPTLPASWTVETRAPNTDVATTSMWPQWTEYALPVIRGYSRVSWLDRKTYGATSTTMVLPRLNHDASWWAQGGTVQRIADYLAQRHANPVVTISGLQIVPDQRIEIGDVLTVTDATYAGLSARVVVTGLSLDASNGSASMSLDVEVTSVTATRKTYADVQAQAGSRTYDQFKALIGAVTYTEQEAA